MYSLTQFSVNETPNGIVAPGKDICKVKGCNGLKIKGNRPHAFCKKHSGLRTQISKRKFKEFTSNNEIVIVEEKTAKKKGPTSKKHKWRAIRKQLLAS